MRRDRSANVRLRPYLKHSDLGETAFEVLLKTAPTATTLSTEAVANLFLRLHGARGPAAKLPILSQGLRSCTPLEAKYLIKILTGDLRIGLKEGLVEDGIGQAFAAPPNGVRNANLLLGDIGETAKLAQQGLLASATLTPFRPLKSMLASPEPSAADIWARVVEWTLSTDKVSLGAGEQPIGAGLTKEPPQSSREVAEGRNPPQGRPGARRLRGQSAQPRSLRIRISIQP